MARSHALVTSGAQNGLAQGAGYSCLPTAVLRPKSINLARPNARPCKAREGTMRTLSVLTSPWVRPSE
ncbi:hypothetical protein RSAG8_04632, partial [Rhizoctonia solani AG-8 WAC10335]